MKLSVPGNKEKNPDNLDVTYTFLLRSACWIPHYHPNLGHVKQTILLSKLNTSNELITESIL